MTPSTIDFTSGANPLGPSNKAKNAIRSLVRHISAFDDQYLNHLKRYIAKLESVDEACITFGCGSTAILKAIFEITRPKKILVPYPDSQRYRTILSKHSLDISRFSLKADDNFCLEVDDFCKTMNECDVVLMPNPHDVTGSVVSSGDLIALVNEAQQQRTYLILDESYRDYIGMSSIADHAAESGNIALVRTFSIFHALGGLRIGYVIASPNFVKLIEPSLESSMINSFAPRAAIASIKDKAYQRRSLHFIENEKAYLSKKLSIIQGIKCRVSPTNILVIQFQKDHLNGEALFRKYHVSIQSFTDEHGNFCVRFPVQSHRQNAYFVRILKHLMEA